MQKKLKQSYIMLSVTFFIFPLFLIITLFLYPLNHNQVVEHAQSLASGIDASYYLSDEKIVNNVDYLLFSSKNDDSKVVVYSSKAPIFTRFNAISYIKMNNFETINSQNESIRIIGTSLKIEQLPLISELMLLVGFIILWLAYVFVILKRVISLRKTVHAQSGGDIPE